MRFSDAELTRLRQDVDSLGAQQASHSEQMQRLTEAIEALAKSTSGIVQLYSDVQGATRLGVALQKFLVWLIKMGAWGVAMATGITYVLSHFKLPPSP